MSAVNNSPNSENPKPLLYQISPRQGSKIERPSKTGSIESFRKDAKREYMRLKLNGTIPNHIVQVNYLNELSDEEIQALWEKHRPRLTKAGIVGRVALEITTDGRKPVNRVHYHLVIKDHTRTHAELKELIVSVFQCEMPPTTFKVNVFSFDEQKGGWKGYIAYFVKLRDPKKKNVLFEKGLVIRRYYTINRKKWWTYPDGRTHRPLADIDKEIERYATSKRLEKSEILISHEYQRGNWTPDNMKMQANRDKLKRLLYNESDETLYDWFSVLMKEPTLFNSRPPGWLLNAIHRYPLKCNALITAIYDRIWNSENEDIILALEIYHGLENKMLDNVEDMFIGKPNKNGEVLLYLPYRKMLICTKEELELMTEADIIEWLNDDN